MKDCCFVWGVFVGQFWLFVVIVILNSNQNAAGCFFFPPTMVFQGSESINY